MTAASGTIVWSTVIAYDGDKITDDPPQSWADFWDTEKYPGKRGMRRHAKYTLEFALMADGVPPDQVYEVLRTDEGVDRAFAKLDELKDDIIWWEAGAQPPQLLAAGEVIMTNAYNGRISAANKEEGRNFKVVWPQSIYAVDSWVILANSPHKEAGIEFIEFASQPEHQSNLPLAIAYGVTHKDAAAKIDPEVLKDLPTAPENLEGAIELDTEFWVENVEPLDRAVHRLGGAVARSFARVEPAARWHALVDAGPWGSTETPGDRAGRQLRCFVGPAGSTPAPGMRDALARRLRAVPEGASRARSRH